MGFGGHVSRQQLVVYAAAAVVLALIGARYLKQEGTSAPAAGSPAPKLRVDSDPSNELVHVAGAVRRPGLYRLGGGARVGDAVKRAGGPRPNADLTGLNLAAKVEDGQQVVVPTKAQARAAAAGAGAGGGGGAGAAGPKVSLNSASLEQLDTLEGIGPVTAQKIIDYRTEHGGFRSVEDLKQIPGIGDVRFEAIKDRVQP